MSDVNLNSYIRNSENNECFGLYYYFLWFFAISLMGILCHLIVNKAPNEQQYPTGFKNEKEWMFIVGGNLVVLLGLPIALQLASELWEFFGLILLLFLLPCGAFMMTGVFTIGSKDEIDWGNTYDCLIMTIFIGYFIIRIIVDISGSPSSRGGLDIALFFIVSFSLIGIVLMPTLIAFDYYSRLALKITLVTIMLIISITLINVLFFNDNISN